MSYFVSTCLFYNHQNRLELGYGNLFLFFKALYALLLRVIIL